MSKINLPASRAALVFVMLVAGVLFGWWYVNRPSYLMYQAHQELAGGNQAGVILKYKKLLSSKDLPKPEEIRLRKALGEFYVRALSESDGTSLYFTPGYEVENPFLTDAKKEFEKVIALEPQDSVAHYYLGRILWMQRLETFAIQELDLSRKFDPKNPEPLSFLARAHLERGDASKARELALQALSVAPDHDQARLALIDAYAALGDYPNAFKEFDRLSSVSRSDPDTLARHALILSDADEWSEAMRIIGHAVKEAPDNGRVRMVYGRLLLERGQLEEAAGQLAQSAALMPKNVWPLVWQVKCASERGQCDDATRASQFLIEAFPRWGWARLARAWHWLCKGDTRLALSELEEAERMSPDLMEATELRIKLLLDEKRFKEAGDVIRLLLDQKKHESKAYAYLAKSFHLQNKPEMAREMEALSAAAKKR